MSLRTLTSLGSALSWVAGLPRAPGALNPDIEGAPKAPGDVGPTPKDHWRSVRPDLSDLPRGERWILRVKGQSASVAVMLPIDAVTAELDPAAEWGKLQSEQRAFIASQLEWMRQQREAMREVSEIQANTSVALKGAAGAAKDYTEAASNATTRTESLLVLTGKLQDQLAQREAWSEGVRQVSNVANRAADYLALRAMRDSGQMPPEMVKRYDEMMRWERLQAARGNAPASAEGFVDDDGSEPFIGDEQDD